MVSGFEAAEGGEAGAIDAQAVLLEFEEKYRLAFEAKAGSLLAKEVVSDVAALDTTEYDYYRHRLHRSSSSVLGHTEPFMLRTVARGHLQKENIRSTFRRREFISTSRTLADLIAISMFDSGVEGLSNGDRKYRAHKGKEYHDLLVEPASVVSPMPKILTYSNIPLVFNDKHHYPGGFRNHVELYIDIKAGLFDEFIKQK